MDVIPHTGAVRSRIVIPIDRKPVPSSLGYLYNIRHQVVGDPIGPLSQQPAAVSAYGIEVPQEHDGQRRVGRRLDLHYDPRSRIGRIGPLPAAGGIGTIVVLTAGTSDIPVAEEAAQTAEFLGNRVERLYDVGVSGIHRLLARMDCIMRATVVIAIAGMEGAIASVVGGLADCPVIAVPTSVGYGASFGGLAALLSMLNSCASGVSVVNIDNGFGAGYLANMINHTGEGKS